jgi:uncharacterized protein YjlB
MVMAHLLSHSRWPLLVYPAAVAIVLPAGTRHKKLSSKGNLGVVGAYPARSRPDTCIAPLGAAPMQVPLPSAGPVFGKGGPLFGHWRG